MKENVERTRLLITVMTYPHPNKIYEETVCTAGITSEGEWIRLYPVDYRYRPKKQQFRKYQWIDIDLKDHGYKSDNRKESREPVLDTIQIVGERISTKNGWIERRKIIDPMPHYTVHELEELHDQDRVSLGIVRPSCVLDIEITKAEIEWSGKWKNHFAQMRLFGEPLKPLKKIPYEFRYVFECEDSKKPHKALISDWELGTLYLKEEARLGSPEAAAESVKHKFFDEICGDDKDTRFYMGTTLPFNSWIVIGTFWPPKSSRLQPTLF